MNSQLHRFVDKKRVREAILRAEQKTDAPISVSISPHVEGKVHAAAVKAAHSHRLERVPARNAVHFFVVPSRREFAVVGDAGAHEKLGQDAWDRIAAIVEKHFRLGDPTAGLVAGIEEAARLLAPHFPRKERG